MLELRVPPGTEVEVEGDKTRHDLVAAGQRAIVARGGSGGRGNKRFAGPTGLEEYAGFGVSMALLISVANEALCFRSAGYALQLGRFRLPMPEWLTPGDLTVTHADLGGGSFRFTLEIVHPRFGAGDPVLERHRVDERLHRRSGRADRPCQIQRARSCLIGFFAAGDRGSDLAGACVEDQ